MEEAGASEEAMSGPVADSTGPSWIQLPLDAALLDRLGIDTSIAARLGPLSKLLQDSPGAEVFERLNGLSLSLEIFQDCAAELEGFIKILTEGDASRDLYLYRRDQFSVALRKTARFLHNYVSAAMSLVDHTRRLYQQHYKVASEFSDYDDRVNKSFAKDPLAQFVKGLRQYVVHRSVPPITFWFMLQPGPRSAAMSESERRFVGFRVANLELFDNWPAEGKNYFKGKESIDLLQVCSSYTNKVVGFHGWLRNKIMQFHRLEIGEALRLQQELRHAQLMAQALSLAVQPDQAGETGRMNEHSLFFEILSSMDMDKLYASNTGRAARAEFAIQLLARSSPVPDNVCALIRAMYREPNFRVSTTGSYDLPPDYSV
jgi:hypothetical protein